MKKPIVNFETFSAFLLVPEVRKICQPLFDMLNVSLFYFQRAYYSGPNKGKRLLLASDERLVKEYFNCQHYIHELANYPQIFANHRFILSLWEGCKSNHAACEVGIKMQQHMQLSHFLYLTWINKNEIETFCFAIKEGKDHIPQIFLFNHELFKYFCLYFKDNAQPIIAQAEKDKFSVSKNVVAPTYSNLHYLGLDPKSKQSFFKELPLERIFIPSNDKPIYLTIDEAKTIVLACQGLDYQDIAKRLSVSVPTIKYRMKTIKEKCDVNSKHDLIQLFMQQQLFDYCKLALNDWLNNNR